MGSLKAAGYQLVPLTKLLRNGQNAIMIADGVGVGKTIAAGYILAYLTEGGSPALVVCPPGLQEKWRIELREKFALSAVPISEAEDLATAAESWHLPGASPRVYILPSSLLVRLGPAPFPGPVVIDEIHNYRNSKTALWKAAKVLTAGASHRVGLTATPINNCLGDLSAELAILLNIQFDQADALVTDLWRPEYRSLLYPLLTRFSKERLGIHFATRDIRNVKIEFGQEYVREAVQAIKGARSRPPGGGVYLDEITYFRLAASSPVALARSLGVEISTPSTKVDALRRVLDEHSTERVLVFCEFEETALELERSIGNRLALRITGCVPVFEREAIMRRFREAPKGVLVMTAVGSEGLDLQFCSTLVNYDLTWNPMVIEQRIGRIDRIGQEKDSIVVYNFCVAESIDERIMEVLGAKLGIVNGSVLEPQPILTPRHLEHRLVSGPAVSAAMAHAKALATAVALSGEIIPDDYGILPAVDEGFCDLVRLRGARRKGQMPWLHENGWAGRWLSSLDGEGSRLSDRVGYYSS